MKSQITASLIDEYFNKELEDISHHMDEYFNKELVDLYLHGPREDFLWDLVTGPVIDLLHLDESPGDCWVAHACRRGDLEALEAGVENWAVNYFDNLVTYLRLLIHVPDIHLRNRCDKWFANLVVASKGQRFNVLAHKQMPTTFKAFLVLGQIDKLGYSPSSMYEFIGGMHSQTPSFIPYFQMSYREALFAIQETGLWALVVFQSDGLLRLTALGEVHEVCNTRRFFRMMLALPFDLQMIICSRAMGSAKSVILSKDAEPAFIALAALG